jgi:metal-responsive CopG/Arc/MetJ family transcriptional regulator
MKKDKKLQVQVTQEIAKILDEYAKKNYKSRSAVLTEALLEFLNSRNIMNLDENNNNNNIGEK